MDGVTINEDLNQIISINGDSSEELAVIRDDANNYVVFSKEEAQIVANFLLRWIAK